MRLGHRQDALERSEVRAAQPHPHVHALRGPAALAGERRERRERPGVRALESGDGVVPLGEAVLERHGRHLEARLARRRGRARGLTRHPFVTSSGK